MMRRWLLITKEKDYSHRRGESDWIDLDKKKEVNYYVDRRIDPGDKVLVYQSGQWTMISYIFDVKDCKNELTGVYKVHLHNKKKIPNGVKLSELKNEGIIKENRKFRKRIYKVPLCCWSEIVGYINEKNPKFLEPPIKTFFKGPDSRGYPFKLKNEFIKTLDKIKKINNQGLNEEATKYCIILPLLKYMALDIQDSSIVYPEDPISERFVDYILTDYNSNNLLIEAKKPSIELDGKPERQIRWYCASKNINQGILTNGIKWRFYEYNFHDAELGAIKKIKLCHNELDILIDDSELVFKKFLEIFWNGNLSDRNSQISKKTTDNIFKDMKELNGLNESEVKQLIIIPLLESLGWDISRQNEFLFNPETIIKTKKNNKTVKKKIHTDYALIGNKKICFEVKKMGIKGLDVHAGHVMDFCANKNFDIGIATDGKIWEFVLFKDKRFYDEKIFDIDKDYEELLTYFDNYLARI